MATEAIYIEQVTAVESESDFSFMEKMVFRRFQPQSILIDLVGMTWFTYFFWSHQWAQAIAVILFSRLLALTIVRKPNYSLMAETTWGKVALLHLHPANVFIQVGGL